MASFPDRMSAGHSSRRSFLRATAAVTAVAGLGPDWSAVAAQSPVAPGKQPLGRLTQLSEHLWVYHGPINVGIVRNGEKALLIDAGDGSVAGALAKLGITTVEQIVLTHHHRDQACGARAMAEAGAKIGVPAAERDYFANPTEYWNDDKHFWHLYQFRPHPLMLAEPLGVEQTFADGDQLTFGPAKLRVISTPGHTDGSVSYRVDVDGRRVIFSGDCIYDAGQLWDVYSLQKGFEKGGRKVGGYHGFMGDHWRLIDSLERIKDAEPELLVPAHGKLMPEPAKAIDLLTERLTTCYENYVAISALRRYFPELFTDFEGRPGQMPIRPGIQPPDCLRHFGTTWMLVSQSGAAFVMDAGSAGIVERLKKMLNGGEIKSVEGLWVTHYHDDHTAGIPAFQQQFDCPCFTDRRLVDVLTNPTAWRLPCVFPTPIRVDRPMEDGQSWSWHEFTLTSYFYPGQTLYHAALLVERDDLRMLFVGDSHTMAGSDDYCAYNRNWLGRGVGFQYCLTLVEKLQPTHMFNCHVDDAFAFTAGEIRQMRANLDAREKLLDQLMPWDHANFGTDASWVRCYPYTQKAKPGDRVSLDVVIMNHSAESRTAACRAVLPTVLGGATSAWVRGKVAAKSEGHLAVSFHLPPQTPLGRYVVPVDIQCGRWQLPQFAEAIVEVEKP